LVRRTRIKYGADLAKALREIHFDELAARSIVMHCVFIPLFAFRELRRVMGEDESRTLLFASGGGGKAA